MMAPFRSANVAQRDRSTEETIMDHYHSAWELHRKSTARQSDILRIIADYRYLAAPALAARERLAADLVRQAALRDGGALAPPRRGATRRWLGVRLVRLGTWLGGIATPPLANGLTTEVAGLE
jgi:hypothetical protein